LGGEGSAIPAIRAEFGDTYITLDGEMDRAKMRALIFSDSRAKLRLEGILHPLIREQALSQLQNLRTKPYVIVVVPLLAKSPTFRQLTQRVLVVDCEERTQIARVIERSQISVAEVRNIIVQQTPREELLKLADDLISNDSDLDSLADQVNIFHQLYSNM
jgi:dephospho-CoA kinase